MAVPPVNYLEVENHRNHEHRDLYTEVLQKAFNPESTLIAHHICFTMPGEEPQEIPSADALLFDHTVMEALFGDIYLEVLKALATAPVHKRDTMLRYYLNGCPVEERAFFEQGA